MDTIKLTTKESKTVLNAPLFPSILVLEATTKRIKTATNGSIIPLTASWKSLFTWKTFSSLYIVHEMIILFVNIDKYSLLQDEH